MLKSALLLICGILAFAGLSSSRQTNPDISHDKWLMERYFEATSIKEGMTRADLLKVFRMDGGLQGLLPTRYVLKSSNFIKVDVEFNVPQGAKERIVPEDLHYEVETPLFDLNGKPLPKQNYKLVPNEQLKIKSISRPYIEQFDYD